MLSWEKIDAIPGWFMFQSYCVWRALLDQQARIPGDLFEIGVWRGRSASVLASYRKGDEKLYLCDLRLEEEVPPRRFAPVGVTTFFSVPATSASRSADGASVPRHDACASCASAAAHCRAPRSGPHRRHSR